MKCEEWSICHPPIPPPAYQLIFKKTKGGNQSVVRGSNPTWAENFISHFSVVCLTRPGLGERLTIRLSQLTVNVKRRQKTITKFIYSNSLMASGISPIKSIEETHRGHWKPGDVSRHERQSQKRKRNYTSCYESPERELTILTTGLSVLISHM